MAEDKEPHVCHGCFMECEQDTKGKQPFPCKEELRVWAALHKDEPAGYVFEPRRMPKW